MTHDLVTLLHINKFQRSGQFLLSLVSVAKYMWLYPIMDTFLPQVFDRACLLVYTHTHTIALFPSPSNVCFTNITLTLCTLFSPYLRTQGAFRFNVEFLYILEDFFPLLIKEMLKHKNVERIE